MNKNVLIVLGGGFVIAMLVALIVQAGLSSGNKKTEGTQILIAANNLVVGHVLTPADVKWQNWPQNALTKTMIVRKGDQKLDEVAKGKMRRDIPAGEPVTTSAILSEGKGNVLAVTLEPGMRAVAIKGTAESMVAGFIAPGDHVDVILTYDTRVDSRSNPAIREKVQRYATETILEDIRVLAIDQQARREDDEAKVGRTVTLEVTPAGAEKINVAGSMGKLTLALRPVGEKNPSGNASHPATTDTRISRVLREVNKLQGGNGGTTRVIRTYNGENVENMVVRSDDKTSVPPASAAR